MKQKKHLLVSTSLVCTLAFTPLLAAASPAVNGTNAPLEQQESKAKTYQGQVVDESGETLIGVSVLVKGTTQGVVTDMDGNFQIRTAVQNPVFVISYIGYATQEVTAKAGVPMRIKMKPDTQVIDEVVVTALGIKRQTKALAYNAQELKGDLLSQGKDANFLNGLNGKVAGVTINQSSAGAGSAARVVMRGAKSIDGNNNALYVVDGVPLLNVQSTQGTGQFNSKGTTDAAADINPDDIASVTVLSGASAAALYGSAAANGAILITTKKGNEGKLNLSYQISDEWGKPLRLPQFQNRYGSGGSISSWGALLPETHPRYNVTDFFQTANTQTHSLSLSGGTEKNQTYVSAAMTNNKGLVPNNKYNRYNISVRNSSAFLDNKLRIDAGVNYVKEYHRNMTNQGEYSNPMVAAYLMPRSETMDNVRLYETFDGNIWVQNWTYGKGDYTLQNPYWQAYRNLREMERERYVLSLGSSYEIYKWNEGETWTIAGRANYDRTGFTDTDKIYASTDRTIFDSKNGGYGQELGKTSQVYLDLITTINKNFELGGQNYLSLNTSVGGAFQDNSLDAHLVKGPLAEKGFPNLFNIFNVDKAAKKTILAPRGWREQTQSVFASAELGFNSYLFLTLTGRNDWASQLANSPNSSFFYPSVGLSGVVTDMLPENIRLALRPYLGYLKVRAAYASVASPFPRELTTPTYVADYDSYVYRSLTNYPIGELLPERTDSYEIGMTSKWFNGMLTLDATLYRTLTKNQTIFIELDAASGYSGMYIQTGAVRNQGLELAAGLNFGKKDRLHYSTNFTFSMNENKIIRLADNYVNPITKRQESITELRKGGLGSLAYILKEGGTLGDIYSDKDFRRTVNGDLYVGADGNLSLSTLENEDRLYLGSVLPKANLGWTHEIGYKGLTLGVQLTGRIGGVVVSMTQAALDHYGVSEQSALARDNGGIQVGNATISAENYFSPRGKNRLAQYYTYDATNFRVAEAHISYKLDRKYLCNIADLTLSLVGRNLGFLYVKAPFDPESISSTGNYAQGMDYFMMPTQRTLGFSFKVNF